MVYLEKFVAAILTDGQVLREYRNDGADEVKLPFGSKYSIRLKNLHTQRAVVKIWVDGEDVVGDRRIVVSPNETVDLEGPKKNNAVYNKFKFIEKTDKVEQHRGNREDDGLIRIEFQFEQPKKSPFTEHPHPFIDFIGKKENPRPRGWDLFDTDNTKIGDPSDQLFTNTSVSYQSFSTNVNDEGITVKGSETDQKFQGVEVNTLEPQRHSIVMKLSGYHQQKQTKKAVGVKTKVNCETCGTTNNSRHKFCTECGTYLL